MTTRHELHGRSEDEILWYQRRGFLQAAAAWTALGGITGAMAQQRGNVVQLTGDATVNGSRLLQGATVQTGDEVRTGPGSTLIFVVGTSAFHVRQNSLVTVERGSTLNSVSLLRLLTGAVVSVWGRGGSRAIVTPTLTAGIRGTGVYTEVRPGEGNRTYFCNCYGTVQFDAGPERQISRATYHKAIWVAGNETSPGMITEAPPINHSDAELEFLAGLVNQRTAWQITGNKVKGT